MMIGRITRALIVPVALLALAACSAWTEKPSVAGMNDGRLRQCPGTPNCVCSEYPGGKAYIKPFKIPGSAHTAWEALRRAVEQTGGTVKQVDEHYLWATYTTLILRFVDDVEFRLSVQNAVIEVRSASRVGHYDFGVNRRRVERVRKAYQSILSTESRSDSGQRR